jgi:hypothetical protein
MRERQNFSIANATSRGRRSMAIDYLGITGATGIAAILLTLALAEPAPRPSDRWAGAQEFQPVSLWTTDAPCPPMATPSIKHTRLDPINLLPAVHRSAA